MADLDLRTDYKDDILDSSVNEKRKYNIIENTDGTKSLEDVSVYTQRGDSFGAVDINKTNQAVLVLNSSLTLSTSEVILSNITSTESQTWNHNQGYKKLIIRVAFENGGYEDLVFDVAVSNVHSAPITKLARGSMLESTGYYAQAQMTVSKNSCQMTSVRKGSGIGTVDYTVWGIK